MEIYGIDCTPRVGLMIRPENWAMSSILLPGDDFSPFRIRTSNDIIPSLACRVEVTGRTFQKDKGCRVVRVKITFVGDGEPDQFCRGFMGVPYSDGTY